MVMRNRHDGANPPGPGWWDDLPPGVKKRCSNSPERTNNSDPDDPFAADSDVPSPRMRVARDLSWLALIFVIIALANILFLLAALSFLHGRGLFGH